MESFDQLVATVEGIRKDVEKADKGNRAAGTRVRKAMQEIKKQAQVVREDILAMREKEDSSASCGGQTPCCQPPPAQNV